MSIDEFAGFKLDPAEQLLERKRQAEMLLGVFQNLDTNADGRLSEAEYVGHALIGGPVFFLNVLAC